jgi:hypothetical protein
MNKKRPSAGPADGPWYPKVFMPSSEPAVADENDAYNDKYEYNRYNRVPTINDFLR